MTTHSSSGAADWDAPRLARLADHVEERFGAAVEVGRSADDASVDFTPRQGACPLHWTQFGDELILGIGSRSCRWELGTGDDDLAFIEVVVEAVAAGRVFELFGPARWQVTVRLADGSRARTSSGMGLRGCLPVPGWTRRARRVDYLPYA
ncbi:hypothetical protein GCM10027586_10500 [Kineococcus gypseus]|uniref:hypothetical protein n=1 Tax=Kineococcus gypseus TaxID=1637102 RepID=UPI003D7CC065